MTGGVTTVDETSIRARIRRMVESAEIPCDDPETIWAGKGTGERCVACARPIAGTEIEYEVELAAQTYRLHRACFVIWEEECEPVPPAGFS
jgi:hypothetical protein